MSLQVMSPVLSVISIVIVSKLAISKVILSIVIQQIQQNLTKFIEISLYKQY
jgi:hypothetical protein